MKLKKLLENHLQKVTGYSQVEGHDDHEVSMALTDLRSIAHRAAQLADHLEREGVTELEGWVQSKITKSADYINAVYDEHMFGEDEEGVYTGEHDEEDEDEDDCGCEDDDLDENTKSTCCGRCGHYHVKGTSCPKPFLTGDRHCRNRPRK